ncbi:hypothetical protein KFK09_015667 [Dendrobium nobile]|uniref:Protein HEADING DATE REPRESSOR 1-like n=1 Tax=Dendrobium nobile TaxID=94219 RepID=A0A8T3B5F9_DENNO|nr:hypothetical protein KFK09_015667 [Dendrobium nobile]
MMEGFSPISPPRIFWNSRKRSASSRSLESSLKEEGDSRVLNDITKENQAPSSPLNDNEKQDDPKANLSERRRALFEPLQPITYRGDGKNRTPAEELLPPPDFDSTSYPKGWLVGKKRKLVNVDVVESMRRIAVHEMNRKDREIDGLNEQLEEDAKCLERLQLQLLDERSKRADVERENSMLQNQITMLMSLLEENQAMEDEAAEGYEASLP